MFKDCRYDLRVLPLQSIDERGTVTSLHQTVDQRTEGRLGRFSAFGSVTPLIMKSIQVLLEDSSFLDIRYRCAIVTQHKVDVGTLRYSLNVSELLEAKR
jgi:hypothetical protein